GIDYPQPLNADARVIRRFRLLVVPRVARGEHFTDPIRYGVELHTLGRQLGHVLAPPSGEVRRHLGRPRELDPGLRDDPPAAGTAFVIVEVATEEATEKADAARVPGSRARLHIELPVDDLALDVRGERFEARPQFGGTRVREAHDHRRGA